MPPRLNELQYELELLRLRSHEKHMKYIYGLRIGGLALAGLTIFIGSVMIFSGLQGSFDWAIQAPSSVGAKLTNASPGIVFATVGMFIGVFVTLQKPVNYSTGTSNFGGRSDFGDIRGGETHGIGIQLGSPAMIGDYSDTPDNNHRAASIMAESPRRRRVQKS